MGEYIVNLPVNPFSNGHNPVKAAPSGMVAIGQERAAQEVQAAVLMAKRFPRDQHRAVDRILSACMRPTLAESALYAFPRGTTVVTGPSIRLAEAIAQQWGNIEAGIRELEQRDNESLVESFAWDIETNTRISKVFTVPHERHTRTGVTKLTDPRDIYEHIANAGARRLRACILGVIPGDVVEQAVKQCEVTQAGGTGGASKEVLEKLVHAFEALNVTREQIVKRLGHNLEATVSAEVVGLRKIYRSIDDGMSKPGDWFDTGAREKQETSDLGEQIRKRQAGDVTAQKQVQPAESEPEEEPEQPEGNPHDWPKMSDAGDWVDCDGEVFDRKYHAWNRETESPSVTAAGAFRKRRGAMPKPEPSESADNPPDDDNDDELPL